MARMFIPFLLFFLSSLLHAAEIVVPPGNGTLQSALLNAAEGDTLVLSEGTYSDTGTVIFGQSVIIRALSKSSTAVITASLSDTPNVPKIGHIRFVGVRFVGASLYFNNTSKVDLLEVVLESPAGATFVDIREADDITVVGSRIKCSNNPSTGESLLRLWYRASFSFLGNTVCTGADYINTSNLGFVGSSINIVGNEFIFNGGSIGAVANLAWANSSGLVAANRFTQYFAPEGQLRSTGEAATIGLVGIGGYNSYAGVKNNIFKFSSERLADGSSPTGLSISFAGSDLHNNLFDMGNFPLTQPGPFDPPPAPLISGALLSLKGNVFLNYAHPIIPPNTAIEPSNNLCFNTAVETCNAGVLGNLNQDPLFVDTFDYRLGAQSPAIDAGIELLSRSDLDGSRNDIGPYGGSWSIDQFDRQRDPAATGPYIFPVFDVADGATQGEVKLKFVSYARLP